MTTHGPAHPLTLPLALSTLSYLDELGAGSGQQVEGAGQLPEEVLPGLPEARAPGPVQELLQAGAGLHTSGPVEATQRGAWGGRAGGEAQAACPTAEGARPQLVPCAWLPPSGPQRTDVSPTWALRH